MDGMTVSYPLALSLLSADGAELLLAAELRYAVHDPLAVEALFDDGSDDPVRWVFARDLLSSGLDRRAGDGDVVVWPTNDTDGIRVVHIRLRSPHGDALLEASADAIQAFLIATWQLVPPGSEHEHLDVDGVLDALLGES
jgi:Streptomyces sporulation and cell division protein, SsgA